MSDEKKEKKGLLFHARKWWRRRSVYFKLVLILLVLIFFYLSPQMFYTIEAGEGGVLWLRFWGGVQLDKTLAEGFHFVLPWDKIAIYNLRIQEFPTSFIVLDSAGLKITVDVSIRYHPMRDQVPVLHQEVGPEYARVIVAPEVQALVREVFSKYTAEELYTTKRYLLQNVLNSAMNEIADRYVILDDLLIKRILLPDLVAEAIEKKLTKKHLVEEYDFRLQVEEKEAERKRVEAQGISDFQSIISGGLTEKYLKFRGIEATLKLAESNNAKVIVIGGGPGGLPIILNADALQNQVEPAPAETP
jgi:regulator of protease activity HflC (stomatin/prohibitin superfamily)